MSGVVIDCNLTNIISDNNNNNLNSSSRILHAPENIAGTMEDNVNFLRLNNINTTSIVTAKNYLSYKSDYCLEYSLFKTHSDSQKAYRKLLDVFMNQFDIFHFYFGRSFLDNYEDLRILHDSGKKIVMTYLGSDCRLLTEENKYNPYYKDAYNKLNLNEENIKMKLESCSKYINTAITNTPVNAYLGASNYYQLTYLNRLGLNLDYYSVTKANNKIPVIVHAPTSRIIKGSDYIFSAISKLKQKYKFEFKVIENLPYYEAKKIYEQADLVIDQLILGEYGRFACECMAMGKPVICYCNDNYIKLMGIKDIPIINANPDNIEKVIEKCIVNKDILYDIGIKSRKYVEKYHNIKINIKNLIQIYNNL